MKDGILVLNKPQNWTSHDCVAVCRKVMGIKGVKKIGHGGTLDPMACGVLPIFIGKATRLMEYTDLDDKTYKCKAKLGVVTDTGDIWGEVIRRCSTESIEESDIINAMKVFDGEIEQFPPKYSAIRVNGRKLYEYAREGVEVEIKPRKVKIKSMKIESIDMMNQQVSFEVICSKGTYIRSICTELGEMLRCGAAMSELTRTGSGIFRVEDGLSPEDIKTMELSEIEKHVMPVDSPLVHFGKIMMKADRARYFGMGNSIRWHQVKVTEIPKVNDHSLKNKRGRNYDNLYKVYRMDTGEFLGTGYHDKAENLLKADKILVTR